jgi:hypothetical protein
MEKGNSSALVSDPRESKKEVEHTFLSKYFEKTHVLTIRGLRDSMLDHSFYQLPKMTW